MIETGLQGAKDGETKRRGSHAPEQEVSLLLQVKVAVANGKTRSLPRVLRAIEAHSEEPRELAGLAASAGPAIATFFADY
jgi:hypothetical protein